MTAETEKAKKIQRIVVEIDPELKADLKKVCVFMKTDMSKLMRRLIEKQVRICQRFGSV